MIKSSYGWSSLLPHHKFDNKASQNQQKKEKKKDNNIYNLQEEIMSWKYTLITWDGHKSDV